MLKTNAIAIPRRCENCVQDDCSLYFLPLKCKFMLNLILEQPNSSLHVFFDSIKFDLLQDVDLISLLKGLDLSGN